MSETQWHVPDEALRRFVADPGAGDGIGAASIEAHLTRCAACRETAASSVDRAALTRSWEALADRIDRPRATVVERLLGRLGFGSSLGRLIAATPALRWAGLAATAVVGVAAVMLFRFAGADGPFLVVAPLAPLAAIAAAFVPTTEPGGEASVATPLWGAGLLLRRALAVLALTIGILALTSLALPGLDVRALGWLLPAVALSFGSIALGTFLRVEIAATGLAFAWVTTLTVLRVLGGAGFSVADSALFDARGQFVLFVVTAVSAAVALTRRHRLGTLEVFP